MKKFISMLAVAVAVMLPVSASAVTVKKVVLGGGICLDNINCDVIGDIINCDDLQNLIPEINIPGLDGDDNDSIVTPPAQDDNTSDDDSIVIPPDQDNNTSDDDSVEDMPSSDDNTSNNSELNEYEKEVIRLVNEIRVENGLKMLEADAELSKVARIKSQDMKDNRYFSHTSPTYGSPFDMLKQFGISYRSAGENIARGQATPQAVVNGWMNSEGHRKNILNASYTAIGVGYVADGNYWTQLFIGR